MVAKLIVESGRYATPGRSLTSPSHAAFEGSYASLDNLAKT